MLNLSYSAPLRNSALLCMKIYQNNTLVQLALCAKTHSIHLKHKALKIHNKSAVSVTFTKMQAALIVTHALRKCDILNTVCVVFKSFSPNFNSSPSPSLAVCVCTYVFISFGCREDDRQDTDELKDGTEKQAIAQQAL